MQITKDERLLIAFHLINEAQQDHILATVEMVAQQMQKVAPQKQMHRPNLNLIVGGLAALSGNSVRRRLG
jgi:hypothetical protein